MILYLLGRLALCGFIWIVAMDIENVFIKFDVSRPYIHWLWFMGGVSYSLIDNWLNKRV